MAAKYDPKTKKWVIQYRYTDWTGARKKSTKRGFSSKKEAEDWLHTFLSKQKADFNMLFEDFLSIYYEDMAIRLRENTLRNKKYMIDLKILPYFGKKRINDIKASDIRKWQANIMGYRDEKGKPYAQTYLRALNNQLSAIFGYAEKYYDLPHNPCKKAGAMGVNKANEMPFWTRDEFEAFLCAVQDKHISYIAFSILYWTGMRLGELLALQITDVDIIKESIQISKSYQRIGEKDIISDTKTPNGRREVTIPTSLAEDLAYYIECMYGATKKDRLIPVSPSYIRRELARGIKVSGVKKITVHNIRHSHCSLLVELGVSPAEIKDRLGHARIDTTMDIYAHLYPGKQKQIADILEQAKTNGMGGKYVSKKDGQP